MDNPWDWDLPTNDKPLDRRQKTEASNASHLSSDWGETKDGNRQTWGILPIHYPDLDGEWKSDRPHLRNKTKDQLATGGDELDSNENYVQHKSI